MNILEAKEIQNKSIWYKNPENNVDVKRYIGIAVSVLDDEKVNFILQIDFLDELNLESMTLRKKSKTLWINICCLM